MHTTWQCYPTRAEALALCHGRPEECELTLVEFGGTVIVEAYDVNAYDTNRYLDVSYGIGDSGGADVEVPEALIRLVGIDLAVLYAIWMQDFCANPDVPDVEGIYTPDLAYLRRRRDFFVDPERVLLFLGHGTPSPN